MFCNSVNAHSEELRALFVAHEGQKNLALLSGGTRYTVDFGNLAKQMTKLLDENVSKQRCWATLFIYEPTCLANSFEQIADKELKEWILPDFSTTTENDTIVSSMLMMATLQS
jgi:Domain of unknown function (DUF4419)